MVRIATGSEGREMQPGSPLDIIKALHTGRISSTEAVRLMVDLMRHMKRSRVSRRQIAEQNLRDFGLGSLIRRDPQEVP